MKLRRDYEDFNFQLATSVHIFGRINLVRFDQYASSEYIFRPNIFQQQVDASE